jgi:hypothetical protein
MGMDSYYIEMERAAVASAPRMTCFPLCGNVSDVLVWIAFNGCPEAHSTCVQCVTAVDGLFAVWHDGAWVWRRYARDRELLAAFVARLRAALAAQHPERPLLSADDALVALLATDAYSISSWKLMVLNPGVSAADAQQYLSSVLGATAFDVVAGGAVSPEPV